MSGYISKLQVDNGSKQPIGSNLYGVCDTPAATAAKVVTLADFDSLDNSGVTVHVRFTHGNTAAANSSLTLAVGGTAAKQISNPGGSVSWAEGSVISFTYDGTLDKWQVNDGNVTTITILNTYSATSEEGISGKGVAAALTDFQNNVLGAAALKGVDTSIPSTPTNNNVPTTAAIVGYVDTQIGQTMGSANALVFKGTIGTDPSDTISTIPVGGYKVGWTYRVTTAGTYAGENCEVGDLLIAIEDATTNQSAADNSHWIVAQGNVDSGLFKGTNSFTDTHVLIADGTNGKVKDSGFTLGKSVPSNAVFTDTTYTATANTTIHYLNDANYVKSASVSQGTLLITTVTNASTITPVTAITADT